MKTGLLRAISTTDGDNRNSFFIAPNLTYKHKVPVPAPSQEATYSKFLVSPRRYFVPESAKGSRKPHRCS